MRTRIALAATISIALITVSTLTQAATGQPARAVATSPSGSKTSAVIAMPAHQLSAYRGLTPDSSVLGRSSLLLDLNTGSLAHTAAVAGSIPGSTPVTAPPPTATTSAAPPVAAPAPGPVDTVTPAQRVAWERVAMCEEGGNWTAGGSRFSGGLGISRTNWIAYGGQQFAPEGALATEDQQIMVAERIQYSPPDQYGCRGW